MRLTDSEKTIILSTVLSVLGDGVEVRVYGSRLDDRRRGGDLDLLLKSPQRIPRMQRAELKQALEAQLQIPVDLLYCPASQDPSPFQAIALAQSEPLEFAA